MKAECTEITRLATKCIDHAKDWRIRERFQAIITNAQTALFLQGKIDEGATRVEPEPPAHRHD